MKQEKESITGVVIDIHYIVWSQGGVEKHKD